MCNFHFNKLKYVLIKVCYHNGNYEMSKWLSYKEIQDDAKEKWDYSDIDMYIYITRKY